MKYVHQVFFFLFFFSFALDQTVTNHNNIWNHFQLSNSSENSSSESSSNSSSSSSFVEDPFDLDLPDEELWENFKDIFNKTYSNEEEDIRYAIFINATDRYRQYNEERKTNFSAVFGITKYSDKYLSEILCTNSQINANSSVEYPPPQLPLIGDYPLFFSRCGEYVSLNEDENFIDYCDDFVVDDLCDGCYAFASAQMGHIIYQNKTDKIANISINAYFNCSSEAQGCCGGNSASLLSSTPVWRETDNFPYEHPVDECSGGVCNESLPIIGRVKEIITFGESFYNDVIKTILLVYGPFISSISAFEGFEGYLGGVIDFDYGNITNIEPSHEILVVGYGTNDDGEYLICKNWWSSWGENSYFRLGMDNLYGIGGQVEGKEALNYIVLGYICSADELCLECDKINGKCIECGYLSRLDSDGICVRTCPDNCLTCDKELKKCYSCKENSVLVDNECVVTCPSGCKTCDRETQGCTSCYPTFSLNGSECIYICTDDCLDCDSKEIKCVECKNNSFLVGSVCVVSCPKECKTCDRESQKCYSCQNLFKLENGTCVPTCSDNCIDCDESNTECVLCEYEYILYDGGCYSESCNNHCLICDSLSFGCVKCEDGYFEYGGDCVYKSKNALYFLFGIFVCCFLVCALV
ncbi:Cysteine protease [Entamoeba marina]